MNNISKKLVMITMGILILSIYGSCNEYEKNKAHAVPNVIQTNPNFQGYNEYTNHVFHKYNAEDSHTNDGSGCVQLVSHHWRKALTSPPFLCEKDEKYIFSAYVKVSKFPKGQNVTFGIIPTSNVQSSEIYWNNSKENKWEEVLLPFIATKTGKCHFRFFTYTRAFNNDKEPKKVYQNSVNLDRNSTVYIDDIKIIKSQHIVSREKISKKISFQSSFIKVDALGNFYTKEKYSTWKHVFPKMIYRTKQKQWINYVKYGFNGIMDIWRKDEVAFGLKQGLKYFAMATQPEDKLQGTLKKRIKDIIDYTYKIDKPHAFLMYMFDNENGNIQDTNYHKKLADFVDTYDTDVHTKYRARPIYYLNGQFGLARSYRNEKINVMDITGSYVGASALPNDIQLPKETLGVINMSHNQIVPSPVIQLQAYLNEKFIPSLFFGIIQGGKALSVWRDGGSQGIFQKRPWAKAIKEVFTKIDKMLPIIETPHWTRWSASLLNKNPNINIGTRQYQDKAYLIISNHAESDQNITIVTKDVDVNRVKDYFTKKHITTVKHKKFNLVIGHGNNGYKVLELVK